MIKTKMPLVSVVMPVRNAGIFLVQAISSILDQTYKNIELVIIDDASSDNSSKIIKKFAKLDKRVRVYKSRKNLGISKSANIAISKTKGQFVARMDADDVSKSDRIEKQVNYLINNPDVVAVGGQCHLIDADGHRFGNKLFPTQFERVKNMIFSNAPLQQPTLMVNKKLLPKKFVWYNQNFSSAEELELLFKLFKFGKVENLNNFVLKYRIHAGNTSLKHPKRTFYLTLKTRFNAILKYGYRPNFRSILVNIAQIIVITMLPEKMIYPLYSYLRGFKSKHVKINRNANFILKKAYALAYK